MSYVFEDSQPEQAPAARFVFDDGPAALAMPAIPEPVKPKGILSSAVDTFVGAGARMAQGVNAAAGGLSESFGLDQGAKAYKEGAEYWGKKAEAAGSSGVMAKVYEGVGSAPQGIADFVAGVPFAAAKGGLTGYKEGGVTGALQGAAIESAKRYGLGKIFHGLSNTALSPVKQSAAMAGTMGLQTMAEGGSPQDIAAATITGAALSLPMEGGVQSTVRRNMIKGGTQPEVAADLAGRVQTVFPAEGRFQFEDQAPAPEVSKGDVSNVPLDPARQQFIKDKVEGFGSIAETDRMHPTDSPTDVFARQTAQELFGTPERGFTLGTSSPLETRTDLPLTEGELIPPTKPAPLEPVTVDGQIIPAGLLPAPERGFVMGESKPLETRTDIPTVEGEVVQPTKIRAEPQVIDGQIIPKALIEDKTSKIDAGGPKATEPISTLAPDTEIKPEIPPFQPDSTLPGAIQSEVAKSPLDVTFHPDKRIELKFSEAPDLTTINRLKTNRFVDQGEGVWIAKGDGQARRDFVTKLEGEYFKAQPKAEIPVIEATPSPAIDSGKVEQFTATTRKRGGLDIFDVKLNDSQRRTIEAVRQEVSDGEAGKRVGIYNTNEPGSTQLSWGSSFPEYMKNKGITKAQALKAIDNALSGNGVTANQRIIIEDFHQAKRQQETNQILTERDKPAEVSAINLNEGDSLKRNGEKFKVQSVDADGVTLKDGIVLELNHEQTVNFDRGTLRDAEGKQKKANAETPLLNQSITDKTSSDAVTSKPHFEQTPAGDQAKLFPTPAEFGRKPQSAGRVTTDELPLAEHTIQQREGKQAEMFPHNGGVILDNLGLQQIYERIANTRLVKDVMDDVKALGRHVIAKGAESYKEFFQGMKESLGSTFAKVRPVIEKVWSTLNSERGSIEIDAPRLRQAWDGILRAINPTQRGELAKQAGELLRERMGVREMNRVRFSGELDNAVKKYEEQTGMIAKGLDAVQNSGRTLADRVFSKMSEQDAYDFMQAMDTGNKEYFADKPALNDMAAVIDSMFQGKVKEIQNLGTGAMQNVRDSYFPHIWEKGEQQEQIAKLMGKRPLEGSKGFTKQRVFEDIQTGIDAGFKPISQNPLDLVFLKMGEMDKYIAAHKGLQAMEESGLVMRIPAGEKAPEGFSDIAGKYGITTKQADMDTATGMPGEPKSYRYVAVDQVAQVFNNYLSATLYQNKYIGTPFEAYMGAANMLNQFQLGVGSLFHGGFTSLEAVISRFSLGLKSLSTGDLKAAGEYFATSPVAMVSNWKLGQKVLDAMKDGKAPQGEMSDIMDWLQLAGARTAQDERFRTDQTQKVLQSWSNGKHFGAVARSPLAVVEQSSRIILEHIVPQQKMGVFVEMMKQFVDSNPNATHAELRTAAQAKWSRADARLGQVVYERYFIHNAVKNGLQALIRAPGWTGGTIFELGGGTKDALESIKKIAKGEKTELSDRTAYAISLVTVSAIANGLATLFFTGDMPKGMDFLAFRTGNLDEKGKPERFVFPTYMKDLYAYSQKPGTTLLHKAHPIIGLAGDLIKNKDFYGTEIRHPDDNAAKQVFDGVFHTAKAFTPFWMRGVAKERERGGSAMAQIAPFFGVMPAPADMNATKAEKIAREIVVGKLPQGSKTKEQFEKRQLEHKIENALRKKDPEARVLIAQAKRDKLITPKDEQAIRKAATTPPIVSMTRSLDFPQAMQVWGEASPQEKAKLKQPFIAKGERYVEAYPDKAQEIQRQLRAIRRFVAGTQ